MVHDSALGNFIADMSEDDDVDLRALTLDDLLKHPRLGPSVANDFITLSPSVNIEDARQALNEATKAQDIFVTASGTRDTAVQGMLTNVDL